MSIATKNTEPSVTPTFVSFTYADSHSTFQLDFAFRMNESRIFKLQLSLILYYIYINRQGGHTWKR